MEQSLAELLQKTAIENDFYPLHIADCLREYSNEIKNITDVFVLKNSRNREILSAASEIMSETFDIFTDYFPSKKESSWETRLLVFTAFIHNLKFFSMCWNMMILEKNQSYGSIRFTTPIQIYNYQECIAAASDGFKKFGEEHEIPGFGKIGQECENEDNEYRFYIELEENIVLKNFRVEIDFINKDVKYKTSIISCGDSMKLLRSDPVEVTDVYEGIRNLVIKIIPI